MKRFLSISFLLCSTVFAFGQYSGGKGSAKFPYQIANVNDLIALSNTSSDWGKHFIQTADIDASSTATMNNQEGFSPIGNENVYFTGTYNGDTHIVSKLAINRPSIDYQGMFGYIQKNAAIVNLKLIDVNIQGNDNVGGLVGKGYQSGVDNCFVTGTVSGASLVGGLAGYMENYSRIENSAAAVNVTGTNNYVGGLVGLNTEHSPIQNSRATGDVSGTYDYVGGLIGYNAYSSQIESCYATGNVTGMNHYVGGLVGFNAYQSPIKNSHATGRVTGTHYYVGGLVGANGDNSSVENSFATGVVSATGSHVGELLGYNSGAIINSYGHTDFSDQTASMDRSPNALTADR